MITDKACVGTAEPPAQSSLVIDPVSNQEKALIHSINGFLEGLNAEEKRNDDDYNWVK